VLPWAYIINCLVESQYILLRQNGKKEISSKGEFSAILCSKFDETWVVLFPLSKKNGIENITTYVLLLEYLSIYLSKEGCFELLFEKLLYLLKVIWPFIVLLATTQQRGTLKQSLFWFCHELRFKLQQVTLLLRAVTIFQKAAESSLALTIFLLSNGNWPHSVPFVPNFVSFSVIEFSWIAYPLIIPTDQMLVFIPTFCLHSIKCSCALRHN